MRIDQEMKRAGAIAERRESVRDARAAKAIILDFFILTFHNLEVMWGGIEGERISAIASRKVGAIQGA